MSCSDEPTSADALTYDTFYQWKQPTSHYENYYVFSLKEPSRFRGTLLKKITSIFDIIYYALVMRRQITLLHYDNSILTRARESRPLSACPT